MQDIQLSASEADKIDYYSVVIHTYVIISTVESLCLIGSNITTGGTVLVTEAVNLVTVKVKHSDSSISCPSKYNNFSEKLF